MSDKSVAIDYLSKDYVGLRDSMLEHASRVLPAWQNRSEGDFGVALVELMAYMGDVLSYYGDRVQQEAYLGTATQRASLLQIAALLGYIPSNGVPSTGTVTLQSANPGPAIEVPAGTKLATAYIDNIDASLIFETDETVLVPGNGGTLAVAVTQGETFADIAIGISDGTPGQRFRLPRTPVINGSVRVFVDDTAVDGVFTKSEWSYQPFLVDASGTDAAFTTYVDETGVTWVEFGDGINGQIPNTGLNVYATLRVGGGAVGNIASGVVSMLASDDLAGVSVAFDTSGTAMASAMGGGADAESNEQIRANAPRVFRTQSRAVTESDFADLALAIPGVLRANALAGSFTSVSVYIVGPGGGAPTDNLLASVEKTLQSKALAGTTVTVASPDIIPVNLGTEAAPLVVKVYDNFKRSTVTTEVKKALQRRLAFDSVDFGVRLTVSDFYAAVMSVPGVQYVTIPMLARADATQSGTADMVFRPWEIPTLGSLNLTSTGGLN